MLDDGVLTDGSRSVVDISTIIAEPKKKLAIYARLIGVVPFYGWNRFVKMIDRVHPRKGATLELPFPDGDPEI
jgi:hypothetical protein